MSDENKNKQIFALFNKQGQPDYLHKVDTLLKSSNLLTNAERDQKFLGGISLIIFGLTAPCIPMLFVFLFVLHLSQLWGITLIATLGCILYLISFCLSRNLKFVRFGNWLLLISINTCTCSATYFFGPAQPIAIVLVVPLMLSLFSLPRQATLLFGLINLAFTSTIYLVKYNPPLQIDNQQVNQIMTALVWFIGLGAPAGISFLLAQQFFQLKQVNLLAITQAQRLVDTLAAAENKRDFGHSVSEKLAAVTVELQAVASQQAGGSQEQVATLSQIISFLTEMLSNAANIEDRTEAINQIAQRVLFVSGQVQAATIEVKKSGEKGLAATEQTINNSQMVGELFAELAAIVGALKIRSAKIGGVIELLKNLGSETHLLALNAAIEASGVSGAAGSRFAVVAREVKNLADKSITSSREIEQILTEIEAYVSQAAQLTEQSKSQTAQAVTVAYESGGVIGELMSAIESNSQEATSIEQAVALLATISTEISLATTQQRSATEQAVDALRNLGSVAEQTASSSVQIKETSFSIEGLSQELVHTLAN